MQYLKRVFVLLLCLCLVLPCMSFIHAHAAEGSNVTMTVDKATVKVGEEVTVQIKNADVIASGFGIYLEFDKELLTCTEITGADGDEYMGMYQNDKKAPWVTAQVADSVADTNKDGIFSFGVAIGADKQLWEGIVATLTFTAKEAGTVTFTLNEDTAGADSFKGVAATETVTIKGGCDHANQNFRIDSNANGTHNVVCGDCGQAVEENVTCTVDESKTTYDVADHANCCEPGNQWKYTFCVCGYAFDPVMVEGTIPATGEHTLVKYDEEPATCIDSGHKTYWRCDKLGFIYTDADANHRVDENWLSEGGEGYLAPDPDNHQPDRQTTNYTNNGENHTVSVDCSACDKNVSSKTEGHTYNPDTHVCECTAVEEFKLHLVDADGTPHNFSVPYGENLAKYLNDAALVVPEQKTVDADLRKGVETFKGWCTMDGLTWFTEDSVMPAQDMVITAYYEFTGWDKNGSANNPWVYEIKDVAQKTGWTEIGDSWYYLDTESGARAEGLTRVPYPTVAINGIKYAPNAEDVAYAAANADSKYTDAETAVFCFDENGKFQQTTGIVDGNRYAVDGMIGWHVGLVKVNDDYYYFKGDELGGGNIMATGKVYATRDYNTRKSVGSSCIYYFGDDGKLCEYDGITEVEGVLYYFENSRLMIGAGLTKVGNEYIYVRSNGMLAIGEYWVSNTNKLCDPGMYTFGDDGYMEGVQDPTVNGIKDGYYYKNGKPYYAGLIEIDGDIYYVKSNGQLATGTYYITKTNDMPGFEKGDKLVFGADGKLVTE